MTNQELLSLERDVDYTITVRSGHAHFKYNIKALSTAAKQMTAHEAAVLADGGNLCFGGRNFREFDGTYTGIVHTD